MRKFVFFVAIALALTFSGTAMAADGAGIFDGKCKGCHGAAGAGGPMAPALAGSDFIKGDAAVIKATIADGRSGDAKKYAEFPVPMPKLGLSDAEIDAVVAYLKSL